MSWLATVEPTLVLAYRPFLDPLDVAGVWPVLLLPLALLISIAYKAVRAPGDDEGRLDVAVFVKQAVGMTVQVTVVIAALYAGGLVLVRVLLPMLGA